MKRNIKLIALMLVCVIMLPAVLTGCHGAHDRGVFAIPDEFDESREYTVIFWAKNDTNLTQKAIYEKAMADFMALYPNIKVEMRLYTDYGRLYQDVITNIATDTTPNVCITYPDHIATYNTGENIVVALDELMVDPRYGLGGSEVRFEAPTVDEIVPQFLSECEFGGHYYALPYMRSTEACYVNRTMVEALGYELPEVLTWDFVWEVSEAAMAMDADGNYIVNGQSVLIPFIYKSTDNMMIQALRQMDAGYSTDDGEVLIFNDVTRGFLETIGAHTKNGEFSTFKISSYPGNFLNAGQCIFAVDSTAGATWMGSRAPLIDIPEEELVDFEIEVLPIPQFDPENPVMISQGPSICVFNKADPQEVLASWLFVQFMLTNGVQIDYSSTEGYVPVTTKAQNDPEYIDYLSRAGEDNELYYDVKISAAKLLMDNVDNTFVTPVFVGSAELRNAAGHMIEDVAKSARRKKTIDDAYFETLYADTTTLYHLDQITTGDETADKADLGPLPGTAKALIAVLAIAWVLIIVYVIGNAIKMKKLTNNAPKS